MPRRSSPSTLYRKPTGLRNDQVPDGLWSRLPALVLEVVGSGRLKYHVQNAQERIGYLDAQLGAGGLS
jgi:hypothetical protein